MAQILTGTATPELLQAVAREQRDRRGLSPTQTAALIAAKASEEASAKLDTLLAPPEQETSQLQVIVDLLARIAESQVRMERRLAALESRLAGPPSVSPRR